jgi:hypothetical protein
MKMKVYVSMVPKIYMTNKVNIFDVQIMKLRGPGIQKVPGHPGINCLLQW